MKVGISGRGSSRFGLPDARVVWIYGQSACGVRPALATTPVAAPGFESSTALRLDPLGRQFGTMSGSRVASTMMGLELAARDVSYAGDGFVWGVYCPQTVTLAAGQPLSELLPRNVGLLGLSIYEPTVVN